MHADIVYTERIGYYLKLKETYLKLMEQQLKFPIYLCK